METGTELLSGRLRATGVAELLRGLESDRRSGVLRLGNPASAWVVMADGAVVCAGAADGSMLADGLRAAGMISTEVLDDVVRRAGPRDLPLLDALAREVQPEMLEPVVRARIIETVFDLFLGGDDVYEFAPGAPHTLAWYFGVSVEDVLVEVTTRLREWADIATSIPSTDVVFRLTRHLPAGIGTAIIDGDDWTALAAVDGRRNVAQVIAAVGASTQSVCAGLHRLHERGLIERAR